MKRKVRHQGLLVGEVEGTGDDAKDLEIALAFLRSRGLALRPPPITSTMMGQATAFAAAAHHVYKNDLMKAPVDPRGIAPFVVNAALSIEIYLKTLHRLRGKSMKGHGLLALFDGLTTQVRNSLQEEADRHAKEFVSDQPKVRDVLKMLNNAFEEWRYLYERKKSSTTIHIPQTILVMKACFEVCRPLVEAVKQEFEAEGRP